jgi:hypothetical protein
MGHREILALTYPKQKMPPSAESGNSKKKCGTTLMPLAAAFALGPSGMMVIKNCLAFTAVTMRTPTARHAREAVE